MVDGLLASNNLQFWPNKVINPFWHWVGIELTGVCIRKHFSLVALSCDYLMYNHGDSVTVKCMLKSIPLSPLIENKSQIKSDIIKDQLDICLKPNGITGIQQHFENENLVDFECFYFLVCSQCITLLKWTFLAFMNHESWVCAVH